MFLYHTYIYIAYVLQDDGIKHFLEKLTASGKWSLSTKNLNCEPLWPWRILLHFDLYFVLTFYIIKTSKTFFCSKKEID